MGLQPPRGVTREEVVNICVCNFLLIEGKKITMCGANVLFLCTVRTKLLVLTFPLCSSGSVSFLLPSLFPIFPLLPPFFCYIYIGMSSSSSAHTYFVAGSCFHNLDLSGLPLTILPFAPG